MLNLWCFRAGIVIGWALIIAGLAVIAAECLLWLRNGTWVRWPLREVGTALPALGRYDPNDWMVMRGADRVADWIGSLPTSVVFLVTGMGLAWNANGALEKTEARRTALRRPPRRI